MAFEIKVDKEKCVLCGACAAACKNFEMGSDGQLVIKNAEVAEINCNQDAADACPVDAIIIRKK